MPGVDRKSGGIAGRFNFRSLKTRGAGFGGNERGATAVEFALVALPFFMLMFATLETALIFFAGQALETAVNDGGRLVRTGQAQEQGMTEADFKDAVCAEALLFFDCTKIHLDVRKFSTFDSIDLGVVIDDQGELVTDDFTYQIGEAGDIVVVRAVYEWPTLTYPWAFSLADLANGNHVLAATAVFKNEPFPW